VWNWLDFLSIRLFPALLLLSSLLPLSKVSIHSHNPPSHFHDLISVTDELAVRRSEAWLEEATRREEEAEKMLLSAMPGLELYQVSSLLPQKLFMVTPTEERAWGPSFPTKKTRMIVSLSTWKRATIHCGTTRARHKITQGGPIQQLAEKEVGCQMAT
jgi:hypothetical protein